MNTESQTKPTSREHGLSNAAGSRWIDRRDGRVAICKRVDGKYVIWHIAGRKFTFCTEQSIFGNRFQLENSEHRHADHE